MKQLCFLTLLVLLRLSGATAQVSIVKNIDWYYSPSELTKVGNYLYFTASDTYNHEQLWKSDGTANGTVMVADLTNMGAWWAKELTNVNGTLFFQLRTSNYGNELWKSDGTAAGTVMVKDIYPGSNGSNVHEITASGNKAFFVCDDGIHGEELWVSDGTTAGTILLKDYVVGPDDGQIHDLRAMGNDVFFSAGNYIFHNFAGLHKTDGTPAGTQLVKYFNGTPVTPVSGNSVLFFTISAGFDNGEVWKSDGTEAGTQLARAMCGDISDLAVVNNTLFLEAEDCINYPNAGDELFKISADAANSGLVKDICPNSASSDIRSLTTVGNIIYFSADDCFNGAELWKSDGSANGTVMVKNIRYGYASSYPQELTSSNGLLYFTADPGDATGPATGRELWRSDGTEAGTYMVYDIRPGASGSEPKELTDVNNVLFFTASDGQNDTQLWRTGGAVSASEQVNTLQVKLISNPVRDNMIIHIPDSIQDDVTGVVWSANGCPAMMLDWKMLHPGTNVIPCGALPHGLYFIRLTSGAASWETKLVKM